jgi:MGT family glycosyltransferase
MSQDRPTIVFFPEGAYGPTNNCVGIADVLRRRGARVVFVVEESFAGTLEAKGFEEALMRLKPKPEVEEAPGQFWKDFIRDTAPQFRKPTIEQLETLIRPIWVELIDGAQYAHARLQEIFAELRPDVIVQDNVVAFPSVLTAGVPWVRIMSCNPLEMPDRDLPPVFSGYPSSDQTNWREFRREYDRTHSDLWADFESFVTGAGAPHLDFLRFMYESPYLNLYVYPEEADYERSQPLGPTWHRLDSCVRATDAPFEVPERLYEGNAKIVYLSLGSLGSADVGLMSRTIGLLGATDYGVIVSMGPQHGELTLADNMVGAEFLPQTAILPQVDLVITHGGNNTVTECFSFGVPMVALPLFWDQYDNAQRLHELGFGVRLDPYGFDDEQFTATLNRVASDEANRGRMEAVARRLQARPGTAVAADLIERLARERRSTI